MIVPVLWQQAGISLLKSPVFCCLYKLQQFFQAEISCSPYLLLLIVLAPLLEFSAEVTWIVTSCTTYFIQKWVFRVGNAKFFNCWLFCHYFLFCLHEKCIESVTVLRLWEKKNLHVLSMIWFYEFISPVTWSSFQTAHTPCQFGHTHHLLQQNSAEHRNSIFINLLLVLQCLRKCRIPTSFSGDEREW